MITKFYNTFIIENNLLQTISNLMFLCIALIAVIMLIQSLFYFKQANTRALGKVLFVDFFISFCFLYNQNYKIYNAEFNDKIRLGLGLILLAASVFSLVKQLSKQPKENGAILTTDSEGNRMELRGNAYKKEFGKRKAKHFFLMLIHNILSVASIFAIPYVVIGLDKVFAEVSLIKVGNATLAPISIYSVIFVLGILVISFINWILRKCDV